MAIYLLWPYLPGASAEQGGAVPRHRALHFLPWPRASRVKVPPRQRPSSAPAPPQGTSGARLAALGSSALAGRGRPTGRPATASGARASRLYEAADRVPPPFAAQAPPTRRSCPRVLAAAVPWSSQVGGAAVSGKYVEPQ